MLLGQDTSDVAAAGVGGQCRRTAEGAIGAPETAVGDLVVGTVAPVRTNRTGSEPHWRFDLDRGCTW